MTKRKCVAHVEHIERTEHQELAPISVAELRKIPYHVRVLMCGSSVRYGVFHWRDYGVMEAAKTGYILVEDSILPKTWKLRLDQIEPVEAGSSHFDDELYKHQVAEGAAAMAYSDAVEGPINKLIKIGIAAGGYAWYVVTAFTKCTMTIEWRGFDRERHVDGAFGIGGKFPRDAIEPLFQHYSPPHRAKKGQAWANR